MARFQANSEDDLYEFREKFKAKMGKKPKGGVVGNIFGLSKHLAHKYGGDPGFFSKCMGDEALQGYDHDARSAICARAHKIAIGIWPGEHGGENPMGAKEFRETFKMSFSKKKLR